MTTVSPHPLPPPANWYPDPSGTGQYRYWDGVGWTMHLSPQPLPGGRPPVWDDPVPGPVAADQRDKASNSVSNLAIVMGLVALLYHPMVRGPLAMVFAFLPVILGGIALWIAAQAGRCDEPRARWASGVAAVGLIGGLFFGSMLTAAIGSVV